MPAQYDLLYSVGAGLGDKAKAVTSGGVAPGGSFATVITDQPPETEVNDSGEIVEIEREAPSRAVGAAVTPRPRGPGIADAGAAGLRLGQRPGPVRRAAGLRRAPAGGVALKQVGSFDSPVDVTGAPGFPKLLFVVEQEGRVQVLTGGRKRSQPFLDIRELVGYGGERGLLSLAFAPDYARSRRFYVYYTDGVGQHPGRRIPPPQRHPGRCSARGAPVITIPHPVNANHNGGDLQFLGDLLYFGTGDGGSGGDPPNNAQNKEVLLGKLLRIDPRATGGKPYSVPADNPFVGRAGRDEIYSYGLRNPFRFSFDTHPRRSRGSRSATSARTSSRSSTTRRSPRPGAPTSAGTPSRGSPPTKTRTAAPRIPAARSSRSSPTATAAAAAARSSAATSSATRACAGLRGRYVYADLCEGQLRSSSRI